jgi:hypothetical protein
MDMPTTTGASIASASHPTDDGKTTHVDAGGITARVASRVVQERLEDVYVKRGSLRLMTKRKTPTARLRAALFCVVSNSRTSNDAAG